MRWRSLCLAICPIDQIPRRVTRRAGNLSVPSFLPAQSTRSRIVRLIASNTPQAQFKESYRVLSSLYDSEKESFQRLFPKRIKSRIQITPNAQVACTKRPSINIV